MILCQCDSQSVCRNCGRALSNCNAKRHCSTSATVPSAPEPVQACRVGSVLHRMLSFAGIKPGSKCSCQDLQHTMDVMGAAGCWYSIGPLAASVSVNAKKSGYWCPPVVAALLIVVAIAAAWLVRPGDQGEAIEAT